MAEWLTNLVDPIYGIIDLFLDSPLAATAMTSALGILVAAAVYSLR